MSAKKVLVIVLVGTWATATPTLCLAQFAAPSQVTPQTLRPPANPSNQGLYLPGEPGAAVPVGAEGLNVIVGGVHVDGAFAELAAATDAAIDDIRGQRVSVAKIYAAAKALERAYIQAGYPLVRVNVPPQRLTDHGTLRIVIIDGFIEDIDVSGVPERARSIVAARTASLVGRRHIRLVEIERALLIAGEVPGLRLKSTLMPGSADGSTRLILEGEHRVVTSSLGGDDRLPRSLGTWQLRGSLAVNDAFGAGEQIYGTANLSADLTAVAAGASPLSVFGGGAVIPLGNDGVTLNPEYTHSTTRTAEEPGVPASLGTFERYALRLRDPVIRTRSSTLNITGSVEYITQQVAAPAFNTLLSNDRYAVIRGGSDYWMSLPWGATVQLGGSVSQGLGGRSGTDALLSGVPLSRLGAGPNFTKVNGSVFASQPLPGDMRLDITGLGQLSMGKPMLLSEQFVMDGSNAISVFATGTINVDQGATIRGELLRPFGAKFDFASGTLSPYLFGAIGYGQLFDVTAVEQSSINAGALGLGARGSFAAIAGSPGLNVTLELARQFTNLQGLRQGWRGNLMASMEF